MLGLSRISPNTLLGALLRAPLRLIPGTAVLRVRGGVNKGMRWIVGSSIHGCWLGHYEIEKQAAVRRFLKPGMKVFDVGANAGFYTLAFSRLVGANGHVWAFEPLPENVRNLRRHIALNGLVNVTVVEAAVSEKAGTARFLPRPSNAMGRLSDQGELTVPSVSIDETFQTTGAPDLIKLDVEGAEVAVLEGARRTLSRYRPTILLATHGREQERRCAEILTGLGYEFSYLDGSRATGENLTSDELVATPARRG
jgi:FkbM family methyltransferase